MRFETLDRYVRRLADRYEIGLRTFYRHGLGCEPEDVPALADDPPRWALERLSAGTGLSLFATSAGTAPKASWLAWKDSGRS
jgi:hypothetical protein